MKSSRIVIMLCAVVLGQHLVASRAAAQQQPALDVAIIDMAYIFKSHPRLQAMSNDLKRSVDAADAELMSATETIRKLMQQLEQFQKGSPDYKRLEVEIASRQNDITLQRNLKKKEFLEQDVHNHYAVYQEVVEHVRYYAESNGVKLVLQFNGDWVGEHIDRNDPDDVLRGINNQVVYYNKAIDITPFILERVLNNSARQPVGPAATAPRSIGVPPRQ